MPPEKILLVANTSWNVWNYRRALIQALQLSGYEIVVAAPADRFSPRLNTRFLPLRHLSRRSFSIFQNLRTLVELLHLFRLERPDIVLLFTIKPNTLGNLAARLTGTPTISVVEGLGHSGTSAARWRRLAAPLYRFALRHAYRVIFLNRDDMREFLEQKIITPAQAQIIPGPGIDPDHFQPQPFPRSQKSTVTFLFCGRLLSEKGIREFVEAARQVRQTGAAARFCVVGSPDPGNPASIEIEVLRTWQQEGAVEFFGAADDVRPHLAEADVLVLPSYYREGVPRSVLEAMAMQKIIATTDTPGCRDTVEEGKNGFLFPPRRADMLAQIMLRILALPAATRSRMGLFSRQKVLREFADAVVLPQYLALLHDFFSEKENPRKPPLPPLP
ncbi:MAG: glycosyltransferase family 4 protein [Lewinellaceae bacterium]|nr:glycosyltransferase family 4 protein [Lewinellaceae bacterium]